MRKKVIAFIGLLPVFHKENNRWPYFHNAVKIISETHCENWERQSANGELFRRRNVLSVT